MRLKVSLVQVMKLIAFSAVAAGCVAPMLQLWEAGAVQARSVQGLVSVIILEAVGVPLVWAGLSFLIVGRGILRDRFIAGMLLCSVSMAFGFACWTLIAYVIPSYGTVYGPSASALALHISVIITLGTAALFLLSRLWRGFKART